MRKCPTLLALLSIFALTLSACQTAGAPGSTAPTALQTFDALYQGAVTADDLLITTSTSALNSGLITPAQAKKILAYTDAVKTALDAANVAAQGGNAGGAAGALAAAMQPIIVLSACLTAKPLTVETFDKCAVPLSQPITVAPQ